MGGDIGPRLVVPAVLDSLRSYPHLQCELHGHAAEIDALLSGAENGLTSRLSVIHAEQSVSMDDKPTTALKNARQSSMWQALESLSRGQVDGCVSAGNTGALMLMSLKLLGAIPGIERPAICTSVPTRTGKAYLLDMGANLNCDAQKLHQFAHMATAMMQEVDGCPRPRIGLLNVGSEAGKGDVAVRETARLMAADDALHYCGFVEGDGIFSGNFDIVVCDGFVGNVALKTTEGVAQLIADRVQEELANTFRAKLGAFIARPALSHLQNQLNPANYNGASLLGLTRSVIKSHGSASTRGVAHAISVALRESQSNIPARISEKLENLQNFQR